MWVAKLNKWTESTREEVGFNNPQPQPTTPPTDFREVFSGNICMRLFSCLDVDQYAIKQGAVIQVVFNFPCFPMSYDATGTSVIKSAWKTHQNTISDILHGNNLVIYLLTNIS